MNEKYSWELPEGEYETLGGLVLSVTEDLPVKNQIIMIPGFEFQIESVHSIRIETVKLTVLP